MSFSPVPLYVFRDITDISPGLMKQIGVKFLMLDLDNTIAAYSESSPADNIAKWAAEMKSCGIKLFVVSNSIRKGRVEAFAEALEIDYIKGARKPSPDGLQQVMDAEDFNKNESALVGDQVYTDVLAANRAGVVSIVVRPRQFTNPFLALRYALEAPFRAFAQNR